MSNTAEEKTTITYRIVIEGTCEVVVDKSLPLREQQIGMAQSVELLYEVPSWLSEGSDIRRVSAEDVESITVGDAAPFSPSRWYATEPPAEAWVTVDGAQWATNGSIIVRRGGPTLVEPVRKKWMQADHIKNAAKEISRLLDTAGATEATVSIFNARFAPLLLSGVVVSCSDVGAHQVVVDGEVVAVVMPMVSWCRRTPQIYSDGTIVEEES